MDFVGATPKLIEIEIKDLEKELLTIGGTYKIIRDKMASQMDDGTGLLGLVAEADYLEEDIKSSERILSLYSKPNYVIQYFTSRALGRSYNGLLHVDTVVIEKMNKNSISSYFNIVTAGYSHDEKASTIEKYKKDLTEYSKKAPSIRTSRESRRLAAASDVLRAISKMSQTEVVEFMSGGQTAYSDAIKSASAEYDTAAYDVVKCVLTGRPKLEGIEAYKEYKKLIRTDRFMGTAGPAVYDIEGKLEKKPSKTGTQANYELRTVASTNYDEFGVEKSKVSSHTELPGNYEIRRGIISKYRQDGTVESKTEYLYVPTIEYQQKIEAIEKEANEFYKTFMSGSSSDAGKDSIKKDIEIKKKELSIINNHIKSVSGGNYVSAKRKSGIIKAEISAYSDKMSSIKKDFKGKKLRLEYLKFIYTIQELKPEQYKEMVLSIAGKEAMEAYDSVVTEIENIKNNGSSLQDVITYISDRLEKNAEESIAKLTEDYKVRVSKATAVLKSMAKEGVELPNGIASSLGISEIYAQELYKIIKNRKAIGPAELKIIEKFSSELIDSHLDRDSGMSANEKIDFYISGIEAKATAAIEKVREAASNNSMLADYANKIYEIYKKNMLLSIGKLSAELKKPSIAKAIESIDDGDVLREEYIKRWTKYTKDNLLSDSYLQNDASDSVDRDLQDHYDITVGGRYTVKTIKEIASEIQNRANFVLYVHSDLADKSLKDKAYETAKMAASKLIGKKYAVNISDSGNASREYLGITRCGVYTIENGRIIDNNTGLNDKQATAADEPGLAKMSTDGLNF